ncbi:zinc-binding dehydrogenase-domain-containing protein, partial [Fomes fomentarius]
QIAVASGATVIATSSSDERLQTTKKLGAAHIINYKKTPDWVEEVLKITGGKGVDHVIEVGGPGTILKSVNAVGYGGSIDVIGFVARQADVNSLPLQVIGKVILLRGILGGSRAQRELISAVKFKPVIDKVFDFEHVRDAYAYQDSQQHIGKIVVKVSKD